MNRALPFVVASTLGAFLVLWIELVAGRQLTPTLGGSPAVWNTTLFVFQALLLAGYALAHALGHKGIPWVFALLGVVGTAWPTLQLGDVALAPDDPWLALKLVGRLAIAAGPPFLFVSTTAPLLQRWYANTGNSPWFLYAASNAGSLFAAAGLPLVADRFAGLATQTVALRVALAVQTVLVAVLGSKRRPIENEPEFLAIPDAALRWTFLAFVPCVLLHAATTAITTDVASLPLLWVLTLSAYLASYAIAFSPLAVRLEPFVPWAAPIALVGGGLSLVQRPMPEWFQLTVHVGTLFVVATAVHLRLHASRPETSGLTRFYLFVSIGGALGGAFSALVAPLAFVQVVEYPWALVVAATLVFQGESARIRRLRWLVTGLLGGMLVAGFRTEDLIRQLPGILLLVVLVVVAARAFAWNAASLLGALVLTVGAAQFALRPPGATVTSFRGAFGVHRVIEEPRLKLTSHLHGTTLHGRQSTDPARRSEPLTYFAKRGPVGDVFATLPDRPRKVLVIGLGIGTFAAYARPGDDWTFVELDPEVARIAGNSRWFSYLADAPVTPRIVIADGRVFLAHDTGRYDLVVLDAFASDSVPVHLLTTEAVALAAARLENAGKLLFNVTNRTLDVPGIVAASARANGLVPRLKVDRDVPESMREQGYAPSSWVVVAREDRTVETLAGRGFSDAAPLAHAFTDDFADVLSAWKPRRD